MNESGSRTSCESITSAHFSMTAQILHASHTLCTLREPNDRGRKELQERREESTAQRGGVKWNGRGS